MKVCLCMGQRIEADTDHFRILVPIGFIDPLHLQTAFYGLLAHPAIAIDFEAYLFAVLFT